MKKLLLLSSQKGSALVLTVIVLVNAVLIVGTITAISIVEQEANTKARHGAPAYQVADSAVEALLELANEEADTDISDVCASFDSGTGACDFNIASSTAVVYFMSADREVITDSSLPVNSVEAVRTVGSIGDSSNRSLVNRAIEVDLSKYCPAGYVTVADFCIESDEHEAPATSTWVAAPATCDAEVTGARLCTASEWFAACVISRNGNLYEGVMHNMSDDLEWTGDQGGSGQGIAAQAVDADDCADPGGSPPVYPFSEVGGSIAFRCCLDQQ